MEAIIDVAQDIGSYAEELAAAGVRTVIRYYNHRNTPANPQKCLSEREHWELSNAGLSVCVVFEQRGGAGDAYHPKGFIEDFTAATGARDGARALALAAQLGQPKGSGIYFAVDWDFAQAGELAAIAAYFAAVRAALGGVYRCGVYGSGLVARTLLAKGLVDLVWLAGATGWSGTRDFHAQGGWHLFQQALQRKSAIGGFFYDGNVAHPAQADYGQFGGVAAAQAPQRPPTDLYAVAARSGLKLRRGPGTGFAARRTLPFGTQVHAMGRNGAWMLVDLQGDGKADGHMHADYLRAVTGASA
jgi:Domain of unknown function (DUF1906)